MAKKDRDELDDLLDDWEFPTCTIVDAHSFPAAPLPRDLDPDPDARPDICLGWDERHSPLPLATRAERGRSFAGG